MLRIALAAASVVNVAAGVAIFISLVLHRGPGIPTVAYLAALTVVIQGAYTLLCLAAGGSRRAAPLWSLLIAGETAAVIVGAIAASTGVLYNLNPRNGDHEFGPMMLGAIMFVQAALALAFAARTEELEATRPA
ncbi:MAG: hypothetical protein M3373_03125 [Gemmatimonadota bacterium]|nr:hypothetical protein [Gemmatimonadota bacterium]